MSVPPSPAPSQQALPYDGLEVTSSEKVGGWIVLADSYGVRVAGGRTLTLVDPRTGMTKPAGQGPWDYDYTVLAEYEGGTIFLASGGTLWELALDGTVIHRFDLAKLGTLDAVHVGSFDPGSLWVAGNLPTGNVVARVDIDTGRVLERYKVGQGLHQITDAGGYVFVASRLSPKTVVRIDPRTGALRTVPDLLSGLVTIVGMGDRLWFEEGQDVHCIRAADFSPCGEVQIPRAQQLAADGRLLWVFSGTGYPKQPATVTLVDGMTGDVLGGPVALPDAHHTATISAFGGRAWVGFYDTGRLVGIDRCAPGSCTKRSS
jgi:outer membrane protein assembly factor BamB